MSRAWAAGSTSAWRKLRASVLARDGFRCRLALPGTCVQRADQVHHTLGRAVSGDDPRHLAAACGPCNRRTGDPSTVDPAPVPATRW